MTKRRKTSSTPTLTPAEDIADTNFAFAHDAIRCDGAPAGATLGSALDNVIDSDGCCAYFMALVRRHYPEIADRPLV